MIIHEAVFNYEDYELQMQLNNRIPGLLNLQVICSGGRFDYWYDITGMQSMEIILGLKPVTLQALQRYMQDVCDEKVILENYLLDDNDLVFQPSMMFQDKSTGKLQFCCIPGYRSEQTNGLKEFLEEILKAADHSDQESIRRIYAVYERCADGNVGVEELLRLTSSENRRDLPEGPGIPNGSDDQKADTEENEKQKAYDQWLDSYGLDQTPAERKRKNEDSDWDDWFAQGMPEDQPRDRRIRSEKKADGRKKKTAGRQNAEKENCRTTEKAERKKRKHAKKQRMPLGRKEKIQDELTEEELWEREGCDLVPPAYTTAYGAHAAMGATVCMQETRMRKEFSLVYCGQGQEDLIVLDHFPFTIGKDPDQADGILHAQAVSRLHARFLQEDGEIILEDLNSTNGTFLGPDLISSNTPVSLKVNDHITFGTEEFILHQSFRPEYISAEG